MSNIEWMMLGTLLTGIIGGGFAYLKSSPLIPASTADGLRRQVEDLREENAACRAESAKLAARVTYLEGVVETLRSEAHWWQDRFRKLETEMRKP